MTAEATFDAARDRASARPRPNGGRRATVAVVAPRFDDVGGMQNYARRVIAWLGARDDVEVVVVTSRPGLRSRIERHGGVRVAALGTWLTLSNTPVNPLWPWQLRRLYRRWAVDLVDAHSPVPFLADMAVLAAAGRRGPATVLTYHAGSLVKGSGGIVDAVLRAYERFVLPRVFRRADRVIAVSPVAAAMSGRRDTVTIPPGVDTAAFPAGPATGRSRSVAFVGRLETTSRWKGVDVLLEAFAGLHDRLPGATLEVVGDGDAVPGLRRRAVELGITERVTWHGTLPQAEVAGVLRRVGVTVLPSRTEAESFGMVLVEAMASGCPVIGSDVGGIPYVVRPGVDGLLVPPGDAAALTDAMDTVLSDPALAAQLGRAGRRAAVETWDWTNQEERTMDVLFDALRATGTAAVAADVTRAVRP